MTRRSDALTALVAEIADQDRILVLARAAAEVARTESVAARQALDREIERVKVLEEKRRLTSNALNLIQGRDEVSDETVDAMLKRAAR